MTTAEQPRHLQAIHIAGYRPFAPSLPYSEQGLQELRLAPLTLIFGRNSSGKSALARLVHVVLAGLASEAKEALPVRANDRRFAPDFQQYLHNYQATIPLNLWLKLKEPDARQTQLRLTLLHPSPAAMDGAPQVLSRVFGDHKEAGVSKQVRGLLPDIDAANPWRAWAKAVEANSVWLGPVRARIKPRYEARKAGVVMDAEGAEAPYQLQRSPQPLARAGDWFATHLDAGRLTVDSVLDSFVLRLGRANLADAGEGHQQLLPVLVHLLQRRSQRQNQGQSPAASSPEIQGFIDVLEQPELHLHPSAHGPVADLLIAARRSGSSLVVETHSEDLLLRIRRRVAEGELPAEDVAFHYVETWQDRQGGLSGSVVRLGSTVRRIAVDDHGEVDWWPEGVFLESFEEVKAIARAQRKRAAGGEGS